MLLFGCALATEWAYSLRSQEIIGFDISTEIHIAQETLATGIWHSAHHNDAYGAMLSITVLPSTLHSLTGCSPLLEFKAIYPALTALLPVSLFLVGDRFLTRRFAAGAAALLLVQSYFFQLLPELARQEIAMLFFAGLVAALFDDRLRRSAKWSVIAGFSVGVVVSHYSSAYLAIPVVAIALVLALLVYRFRPASSLLAPLAVAAVVLAGGAAIWYGAVTHSASNLTSFYSSVENQGLNLLPSRGGGILSSYLNGNVGKQATGAQFQRLAVRAYRTQAPYIHPLASATQRRFIPSSASVPAPPARAPSIDSGLSTFSTVIAELILLAEVLGPLAMLISRRSSERVRRVAVLSLGTLAFLAVIRFSGTAAAGYNQTRAVLQSLIILALPVAWLAERLSARAWRLRPLVWPALVAVLTLIFAYQSGVTDLALGGGTSLNLSQRGEDYERLYMTPAELAAARWATDKAGHGVLYADRYGQLPLYASTGRVALNLITPETLDQHAWVYGTHTNVRLGRARGQVFDDAATYHWPRRFLRDHYDVVYANGDSRVYHR